MEFKTIKELYDKVKSGEIDESELTIVLDNDCTSIYLGSCEDENGNDIDNEIEISETNGYCDIEPLYKLLFPNADVHHRSYCD